MAQIETVRTILHDAHNDLLVGQRPFDAKSRPGDIDFFGGRVDPGEDLAFAARREVYEETGIDLSAVSLKPIYVTRDHDGPDTFVRHYFAAKVERFPKELLTEHLSSFVLFAVMVPQMLRFEPHREALARFFTA